MVVRRFGLAVFAMMVIGVCQVQAQGPSATATLKVGPAAGKLIATGTPDPAPADYKYSFTLLEVGVNTQVLTGSVGGVAQYKTVFVALSASGRLNGNPVSYTFTGLVTGDALIARATAFYDWNKNGGPPPGTPRQVTGQGFTTAVIVP
jgi:hypothetical protein